VSSSEEDVTDTSSPAVSVTIATKDRALELETVSLPALARQDTRDFEVVIWDASEARTSEAVVRAFAEQHPDLSVRYFRAPRVGSCSQRNDAVKEARGEIVFFIDDDSEVSPDGLTALIAGFSETPEAAGGALPLTDVLPDEGNRWTRFRHTYYDRIFGLRPWGRRPRVQASGAWLDSHDHAGEVDHLIGCDMAFRRAICQEHSFNEKMQLMAPYALWEDAEFSHRVWQHGNRLFVFEGGSVVHHKAEGDRLSESVTDYPQRIFNRYAVWRYAIFPFQKWSLVPYLWSVVGEAGYKLLQYLKSPGSRREYVTGALQGYRAALRDLANGRTR